MAEPASRAMSNKAAIVGVGVTPQAMGSKVRGQPGWTSSELVIDAFKRAIADAGLKKEQIDGLLTRSRGGGLGGGAREYLDLGEALGINPAFGGSLLAGGATAGVLVGYAAWAVASGAANYVACCFGEGEGPAASASIARVLGQPEEDSAHDPVPWATWGVLSALAWSSTSASRHMALYGTKSEQLAEVAVAFRKHASMNPTAIMQKPITIQDHQESRPIVSPLKLLDCCLVSYGGVCLIVTTTERAKDLAQPVVAIKGFGQGHTSQHLERDIWWYGPHQRDSIWRAYEMAGLGPKDIDVCQFYDNFTIAVIMQIEHAGFCGVGEGGSFVEGGRLQLGHELPMNTHGGHLSHSHPEGFMTIAEGVLQMRHACGPRNVPNAHIELVTGRGLTLNSASSLVLTDLV